MPSGVRGCLHFQTGTGSASLGNPCHFDCAPFRRSRHFAGPEADAPFVLQKSYFSRERFEGTEVRNGLKMHFAGWSQPLESYMAALENAGLAITSLREPVPDTVDNGSHIERWKKIPLFLWLKAIPLPV